MSNWALYSRTAGLGSSWSPSGLGSSWTPLPGLGAEFAESAEQRLYTIERFAKWFYLGQGVLIVLFAISVAATSGRSGWKVTGELLIAVACSFVVAVAAAAVGCLLGFLFGIPKLQQPGIVISTGAQPPTGTQPQPGQQSHPESQPAAQSQSESQPRPQSQPVVQGAQAKSGEKTQPQPSEKPKSNRQARAGESPFLVNTSLEEVSDWLTKIIIGLGLVQFQTFFTYLERSASYAAAFIAHKDIAASADAATTITYDSALALPFFFALIIASLISAALFTYLETRTRLTLLFVGAYKETAADQ